MLFDESKKIARVENPHMNDTHQFERAQTIF